MAGVDLGGGGKHKKKGGGGVKKPKRLGFKLDMTPLVDVAFLLLTFFMFATTMSQPSLMNIEVPPDVQTPIDVKQSELFTVMVNKSDQIYYNTGLDPKPVLVNNVDELRTLAVQKNKEKENSLITILKVDPRAKYETLVTVLDRLNMVEGDLTKEYQASGKKRERKFSIIPMEPDVQHQLDSLKS